MQLKDALFYLKVLSAVAAEIFEELVLRGPPCIFLDETSIVSARRHHQYLYDETISIATVARHPHIL